MANYSSDGDNIYLTYRVDGGFFLITYFNYFFIKIFFNLLFVLRKLLGLSL